MPVPVPLPSSAATPSSSQPIVSCVAPAVGVAPPATPPPPPPPVSAPPRVEVAAARRPHEAPRHVARVARLSAPQQTLIDQVRNRGIFAAFRDMPTPVWTLGEPVVSPPPPPEAVPSPVAVATPAPPAVAQDFQLSQSGLQVPGRSAPRLSSDSLSLEGAESPRQNVSESVVLNRPSLLNETATSPLLPDTVPEGPSAPARTEVASIPAVPEETSPSAAPENQSESNGVADVFGALFGGIASAVTGIATTVTAVYLANLRNQGVSDQILGLLSGNTSTQNQTSTNPALTVAAMNRELGGATSATPPRRTTERA
ncbi:MAG: hypothetical protein IPJ69_10115 [Deltaproteobacteria bacterium]|nr:MAG: hypothetical protein IPJ69_10115 [Deltaproteobacteria bacterium]